MLLRTADPFRDFDRLTQQLLGTTNRPAVMPMDAWREGERFVIEFDLPGVSPESIDLDVERNVLTVRAERVARNGDWERLASERPTGQFSRQLVLGDNLDLDRIEASPACCAWSCLSPRRPSRARSRSPASPRRRRPPRSSPDHRQHHQLAPPQDSTRAREHLPPGPRHACARLRLVQTTSGATHPGRLSVANVGYRTRERSWRTRWRQPLW